MVWPTKFDSKLLEYDAMELPGQQLPSSQAITPLDHLLNLDLKSPPGCQRMTCIMAAIGQSIKDVTILESMMAAGMNIALLNMGYGTKEEHIETIKFLKLAAKNYSLSINKTYPLAIAMCLVGRKVRTGRIADTYGETVELKTGDLIKLTTDETYRERCSMYTVFVDFIEFAEQMQRKAEIFIDNEQILLNVEMISTTTLTCKIIRGGTLGSHKDVFVPNVCFEMADCTDKDKRDIEMAIRNQVDFIIAPFVTSANHVIQLKNMLGVKGKNIGVIAKVQTLEGFRNYDQILEVADGIIISRQELGSDVTPKKLVIAQKNMVARANKVNVPIVISAQLLTSMRNKKIPLRAELLDISNCILDGADGLELSSETAAGMYPVETVACLASACKEAEACVWTKQIFHDLVDKTPIPCDNTTASSIAAVMASQRLIAAAIVVITSSGKSAQTIAKFRPRCPIIAITRYPMLARQLHMWRGIIPIIYEDIPDSSWSVDQEKRVSFSIKFGMDEGFIRVGDPVIIVSGWKRGTGFTNSMSVIYASADFKIEYA